jgi:predicted Ser/Thr protein kinase|tara:strand:+ start:4887 stop:5129 length:243 start_codon:yes stop_codon:yes gene_type:complete
MDQELQRYYENLLQLFTQDGWKDFIEDIKGNSDVLSDILTITDEKQLWYRRGQLEAVNRILSYESTIKNAYEDNTGEDNG